MSVWSLVVDDSDNKVWAFAKDSSEIVYVPATHSLHEDVEIGEYPMPDIGATYDGVTYTPNAPAPYFVVKDGATVIAEGGIVQIPGDGVTTKTLTVQKRDAAGNDVAGNDEEIKIVPESMVKLDKAQVVTDTTDGAEDFTVGEFMSNYKGCVHITLEDKQVDPGQAKMPTRKIIVEAT